MYQFLRGKVIDKINEPPGQEKLILDVNGIGYEISTSRIALEFFSKHTETTVYTTLVQKEEGQLLFGFPALIERELFNMLYSVSGVGPRTALNILNNLTVSEITHSIISENPDALCKAQGIGERTAGRIILELKGKLKNWQYLPIAYKTKEKTEDGKNYTHSHSTVHEARSVLQSLGYSSQEITQAFTLAKEDGGGKNPEELVEYSLKWLSSTKQ